MKYNHKCEFDGCGREGSHKGKNDHWLCDKHFRLMRDNHRKFGHNAFIKGVPVLGMGKFVVSVEKMVKFY